jgi:hypothetical protein
LPVCSCQRHRQAAEAESVKQQTKPASTNSGRSLAVLGIPVVASLADSGVAAAT